MQSSGRVGALYDKYLTVAEKLEASDVLEAGLAYIGRKVGQEYEVMNCESFEVISALESFLLVFIQHCTQIDLVRKMTRGDH
jgi:hypothetical protein